MEQELDGKKRKIKVVEEMSFTPNYLVDLVWEKVIPHLLNGEQHWRHFYTLEQIHDNLIRGQQQLWCVTKGKRLIGALITQLDQFPEIVSLRYVYLGGKEFDPQMLKWLDMIEKWALQRNAVLVDFMGRKGWGKLLRKYGYTEAGVVYRKHLTHKDNTTMRLQ